MADKIIPQKITIFTPRKTKKLLKMSEKVYKLLNDNPVARWSALILDKMGTRLSLASANAL